MDTIFALASAPGRAGVAVIRLSGPSSHDAVKELTGSEPADRGMSLRDLRSGDGTLLDQALVLTFKAPDSFTGEDVAELQIHGSVAGTNAVLQALTGMDRLRLADAGEFTRRALENGKMDLSQVEALADLIDAETTAQLRLAQEVLSGGLGRLAERWRTDLIRAAALIEATIDFVDEDVPVDVTPEVQALLDNVIEELKAETAGVSAAERIRSGFEVAIIGPPNVGKSTLLNSLAGRPAAITSQFAGTTRDVIEVRMDIEGLPVTLLDTAGLRDASDAVEQMGIALAIDRARDADLRVFLSEDTALLDIEVQDQDIIVVPKADLKPDHPNAVSGLTGKGVDKLIREIANILKEKTSLVKTASHFRHQKCMNTAAVALESAMLSMSAGPELYDIAAEEIRTAIRALEALVGRIDVENLLDEIFSSFCVGK